MKKFFILFCSLMIGISSFANANNIDEKLLQAFKTNFPAAEEVTWIESKDLYIVNFKEKAVRTRIVYQKDGRMRNMTRSYREQDLPYHIHFKMGQEYPDKKIFGVIELMVVSDSNDYYSTEYYIKLEDEKNWYTVKVDTDGLMSVTEKFRKG
ncbi:MAG: hypothetical protein ABIR18_08025 [Chitinophagaceae bacterium]